jgi:ATP-dependent helicase/nuclease subunit B
VFTVAAGTPFLPTLADAMLGGRLVPGWPDATDPLSLPQATVYLPTRRAARALAAELALRARGGTLLLPRIVPLGDVDEAEEALLFDSVAADEFVDDTLRPAVPETARRLVLASLALAWARQVDSAMRLGARDPLLVPASPADALALGADLGRLIDTLSIHGLRCDDIHRLVPSGFQDYWEITRRFLAIAADAWPRWCEDHGLADAAARRHHLLTAQAEALLRAPPSGPVIAAGSTGSMPATAALLAAIARLPRGAVVLPGLDLALAEEAWRMVAGEPAHPQALLAALLPRIGVARDAVVTLAAEPPTLAARSLLLSEALRPAASTEAWQSRAARVPDEAVAGALAAVALIEADDDREEALAIAVALREALEDPGRTAALVTPDRGLAERVRAELRRWNVEVDDSAGLALARSASGVFARLLAEVLCGPLEAQMVLALLAHPMARFGLPRRTVLRARATLEIGALRGPVLGPGIEALIEAAARRRQRGEDERWPWPRRRLGEHDWAAVDAVLAKLAAIIEAFARDPGGDVVLPALAPRHEAALLDAAAPAAGEDDLLATDPGGEALTALFDELRDAPASRITGRASEYPAFFTGLMAGRVVRPAGPGHRRVTIWGLLEARLLSADLVVLGGLDEKTWPPETRTDAFLNRPMRDALGLPAPERRIGQTAHDFASALGAPHVVLARARKAGGNPTVPSRFLQRLEAVSGQTAWTEVVARGDRLLRFARMLDRTDGTDRLKAPAPVPPPALVPRKLSVTDIETLVRDPYAIYAAKVLRLDPLDPVGMLPGAADRGTLIHDILGRFAQDHPDTLPSDAYETLLSLAEASFARLDEHQDVQRFWWPRVQRIAGFITAFETRRRLHLARLVAETRGERPADLGGGETFTLSARADRIEILNDGRIAVIDYKTGSPPAAKEVRIGFAPQLTLEAAMAKHGAFPGVPAGLGVAQLLYVKLSGGSTPGEERDIFTARAPGDPDALAELHWARLIDTMRDYVRHGRPFLSRPYAKYAKRFAPYDHLARVREWSLAGDEENGEGTA